MSVDAQGRIVKLFFNEAIARALREEMRRDESIIVLGQDVGRFGGAYKEFSGLYAEFGAARVRDTPVAEASMIGVGAGAAASGLRAVVAITYMDFAMLGFDPLINFAAKARFKTGGQLRVPLVVKTTAGAKGQGVAHSQCIEAWLMSVPGLKVVAPSTPADAYGLLKSALREAGPVVYVDHKRLFSLAGQMPAEETLTPIGKAIVRRAGADVTIATHSFMTRVALEAAEALARAGVSCEVIDLRSLAPLDIDLVAESAARSGKLLTLEEGQITCGVGAEVTFRVRELIGKVKVARLGALPAPVSSNPILEAAAIPDARRVFDAVRSLMDG
jgi:pyruvate/2-oxoglutarate/acetoin dehydrogenase E1 component